MPTIIPRSEHTISRKNISPNALKVLYRLNDAGYRACLVGGGVRDLLLGLQPKDFDVATDATPEQIRELFKNCRLIGRRFRLAHIRFGREIIEVATFRGSGESFADTSSDTDEDDENEDNVASPTTSSDELSVDAEGFVTRNNVYGTIEEDATRRDISVNSLYYDISDFSIIDYCDGVADIQKKVIKLIGDPSTRYKEDPVRMLRVIRFANKLGFTIDSETESAIAQCAPLLSNISPARLIDESMKLLMAGQAQINFETLARYQLLSTLFPKTLETIESSHGERKAYFERFIQQGLINSDERVANGLRITPYYLLAVLLWPPVVEGMQALLAKGVPYQDALYQVSEHIISDQQSHIAIPRRYSTPMREVWLLQSRLERTRGKRTDKVLTHPRFRAAYDFLLLRAMAGEDVSTSVSYWTKKQDIDFDHPVKPRAAKKKTNKKRHRKPKTTANQNATTG